MSRLHISTAADISCRDKTFQNASTYHRGGGTCICVVNSLCEGKKSLSNNFEMQFQYVSVAICRCRLHIRFEDTFEDQSCNLGHVTQEGPVDVYFYQSGYFSLAGTFDGL